MKRCIFCGGNLRRKESATYRQTVEDAGRVVRVVVEKVPADVCQRCGEAEYSAEVAERLLSLVQAAKADAKQEQVASRFYSYETPTRRE